MERLKKFRMVYLATPYSKYPAGIDQAFVDACKLAGQLIKHGIGVYSPIAHSHAIAVHGDVDPLDHKIWLVLDRAMMRAADALVVATMAGWRESYGVGVEISVFMSFGLPILFINPQTLEVTDGA